MRLETETLPLTLGPEYRGFVDYLFLKQEISNLSLAEGRTIDGLRLILGFLTKFPSIRRGYKDYRWLEGVLQEHQENGERVVVSERGSAFTLKVR